MELLASAPLEARINLLQGPYRPCVWNLNMEFWTTFSELPEAVGKEFICLLGKPLSKQLSAAVQPTPTELYSYSEGKEDEITFTALQSHHLAMKKAQEDTQGADVALAKLQNQLALAKGEKQARQIQLAPNNIGLPPAVSRRSAPKAMKALSAMKSSANTQRRVNSNANSAVNSPSLGATRSPHIPEAMTSEPVVEDAKAQKSKALKIPLIHFLAVRPVSEKYLGQTLGCDQEDCLEVLHRVGKPYRLDPSKWDLNDKAFKDLDVWQFNYPTADDRQLAIDRAISSFDRSRLPRSHPLWQKLLPYHERNKGKVLSNLNLSDPKVQRGATPRIQVQSTDDSAIARQTPGHDSDARQDRLAPSDAEIKAKPKSGKTQKTSQGNDIDVRPKAALPKESKKVGQTTKAKDNAHGKPTAPKKRGQKAGGIEVVAKSSEFVHDSDEEDDDDIMDTTTSKEKPSTPKVNGTPTKRALATDGDNDIKGTPAKKAKTSTPKSTVSVVKRKPELNASISEKGKGAVTETAKNQKKPNDVPARTAEKRPPSFRSPSAGSKKPPSDSSQASVPMSKTLSRQRTTSSPHKPSPLGSSPPTNASDLDNDSRPISSTSSTPLIAQVRAPKIGSTSEVPEAARNGPISAKSSTAQPLKRKATDDDAGIHDSDPSLTNGNSSTNGYLSNAKRRKASPVSPPTSDSSGTDNSTDARRQALEQAQRFKAVWAKYRTLYLEVSALPKDVPNRKFDELMTMHERLAAMKADIAKAA
ncbi:MAG: hypothetical protein Q9195_001716 [Heterodermia aff. obscurata]